jgi:hypothetical protein
MSKLNTVFMAVGVVGVLGLTVAQSLQVRKLEARLVDLERSLGGQTAVQVADARPGSMVAPADGQLGMARAAPGRPARGGVHGQEAPAAGASGSPDAMVVGSEEQIAEMVAAQTQRMRDQRRERWSQIGMEQTKETVREIAEQEGIDESKAEQVVDLLQVWSDDRRYLHEGLMDGSLSVAEMRAEMSTSREQLEQEVEGIIGAAAATALWDEISSWRGRH